MRCVSSDALHILDCYLLKKQGVNIMFISEVTQHDSCILEEHQFMLNVPILWSESMVWVGRRIRRMSPPIFNIGEIHGISCYDGSSPFLDLYISINSITGDR